MAVYLISYDIKEYNKEDDAKVIRQLTTMGAVRCLLSEWLLISGEKVGVVARRVQSELKNGDRLLVVQVGGGAYANLLNEVASVAILNQAK